MKPIAPQNNMLEQKEYLREKFISFQRKIADQKHELARCQDEFRQREQSYYMNLFEILDAFENIDATLESKKDELDKTAKMLGRNVRSIHKKTKRLVKSAGIAAIEFPDNRAEMSLCKIVETRQDLTLDNETILSVVKNGYINIEDGTVLRKAEVVTVLN
ncbi:nucleotide exchange factor GrpE [Desulfamplus magnetovallimortis]|nr:nucleotide exchange factor GrpE [Desulfamplus magnetovallimortis]